jgi:hypothetical protein
VKWVAFCLTMAAFACAVTVNLALWHAAANARAEEGYCREILSGIYEVALEQNNALNACIGELGDAQLCQPRLEKCLGVK